MDSESIHQHYREYRIEAHKGHYFSKLQLRVLNLIFRLIQPSSSDVLLDVGCGWGDNLFPLSRTVKKSVGLDISSQTLRIVKRQRNMPNSVELVAGDANHLPFVNGTFSKALFSHTIEHLWTPEKALREIRRILMEKGILLCITPNASCYRNKLIFALRLALRGFTYVLYCLPQNKEIATALKNLESVTCVLNATNDAGHPDHVHEFAADELVTRLGIEHFRISQQAFTGFHLNAPLLLYTNDAVGQIWHRITLKLERLPLKIQCCLLTDMYCLVQKTQN